MVYEKKIKRQGKNAFSMYQELFDLQVKISIDISYIENYLYPELKEGEKIELNLNIFERIDQLARWHTENIADFIKAMEYKDFLASPYWKDISEYKKLMAGNKCQLCNKDGELHTHHRTYSIHGNEIKNLDDLIVLCKKCHAKFHNKEVNYEK